MPYAFALIVLDCPVTPDHPQPEPREAAGFAATARRRVQGLLDDLGTVLGSVVMVLAVLVDQIRGTARARRERERYLALARDLGLAEGQALPPVFNGGSGMASSLVITTLRPGPWKQVLHDVAETAEGAGYRNRRPHLEYERLPEGEIRWPSAVFRPPPGQGLPGLSVTIFLPGEMITATDTVVPDGFTGLQCRLLL